MCIFQSVLAGPGDLPPPSPAPAPPGLQVLNLNALLPLHFAQQLPLLLDLLQESLVSSQLLLLQLFLESVCSVERRERGLTVPYGSCQHTAIPREGSDSLPSLFPTPQNNWEKQAVKQGDLSGKAHPSPSQAAGVQGLHFIPENVFGTQHGP